MNHHDESPNVYAMPEPNEQGFDRHDPLRIDAERGSVSLLMLPIAFFFMPARFMRSFGVHLNGSLLFLVIWLTGMSSMIGSLENRTLFGSSSVLSIDEWYLFWILVLSAGVVRRYVIYGVGGLWYRLRLKMCGLDDARWAETGRVYMISGIAKHTAAIMYMGFMALRFDSFESYLQDESMSLFVTFGYLGGIVMLEIFASVTLFCGSITVFPIKRVWAAVWLLALPILLRTSALGVVLAVSWVGSYTPPPQLGTPSEYKGDMFQFEYPRNWTIHQSDLNPGPMSWVQSSALIGDAIIEMEIVYNNDTESVFEYGQESWLERVNYELGEIREESETRIGGRFWTVRDRAVTLSGTNYIMKLMHWKQNEHTGVLVSMVAPSSAWDTADKAFEHVLRTMKVQDPLSAAPDLESTYTARLEEIQFEMPGNWYLDRKVDEDETFEDGTVSKGTRFIEAESTGQAVFRVYLYESSWGPRAELANIIEGYSADGRLENETSFGDWDGMSGFGAEGHATLGGVYYHITAFVAQLEDGRMLDVRFLNAVEHESSQAPGLRFIEESFKLRLPDPESEPASP